MKHFLLTRWNIDNLNIEWLEERKILFEKFCLPSVMSQTNKNFTWVLICDERTPNKFKQVFESYPAKKLYFDFENYKQESPKQDSISMQRAIDLEYINKVVSDYLKNEKGKYIITSRCDSDDAISVEHIDKIQRYVQLHWKGESFWLNLVRGLKWCDNHIYPVNSQGNPFISFIEPSSEKLLTTYQVCHTECIKTPYPLINIREGAPTWMQVIHGGNLLNKLMRYKGKQPQESVMDLFKIKIK